MKANATANTTRKRMICLLRSIRDLKSFAIRSRVVYKVCYRNLSTNTFDSLLNDAAMCNAVVIAPHQRKNRRAGRSLKGRRKRVHRQFRPGRPALLYKLTLKGHALLRRLLKQVADERASAAQAREEARQLRAQAAQARAEAKVKKEAIAAQRAIREAARQAAIAITGAGQRATLPEAPRAPYIAPYCSPAPPRPYTGPVVPPPAQFNRAAPQMQSIGGPSLADKIRKAGYRVNDRGEILYDNRWISASDWRVKMPHIELS